MEQPGLKVSATFLVLAALVWQHASAAAEDSHAATWTEPRTGMEFVLVPAGNFTMGTPATEAGREAQERLHAVAITRPFYLGRFEVTQQQWRAIMADNPSRFSDCGEDCPVENVNYFQIEEFLSRLSLAHGVRFRLPTEAEWEYACRAGSSSAFAHGDELTLGEANFDARLEPEGTFHGGPTPVGSYAPNSWGFYDMHGNVWEWVEDRHCPYPNAATVDPIGRCDSLLRVIRGGSWYYGSDSARCGLRYTHEPQDLGPSLGFRVARDADPAPPPP